MISSNKLIVRKIVEACHSYKAKHVIVCPGSRNAPFSIAFDNHPEFSTYVIHDERSAAFYALGMIDQLKEPVVIVCTSGSAIQNISPAVSEAYYRQLPLIVISADRPKNWIDQGDGQTIRQINVLRDHVHHVAELSDNIDSSEYNWYANRELNQAFSYLTNPWRGPIHINVGLHEPLYDVQEIDEFSFSRVEFIESDSVLDHQTLHHITKSMSGRVLILCGQMNPNDLLEKLLADFAKNTNIAVLVENTSNLTDTNFVHCIDRTLNMISENEIQKFIPDVLITLGDAIVSKKIKTFLRKNKPNQHWKIGHSFPYMDTYQCISHVFKLHPTSFFKQLQNQPIELGTNNYASLWRQKDFIAKDKSIEYLDQVDFSDLQVFDYIFQYLPEQSVLHMANSSVVRYCQLFDPIHKVDYFGNRGTSGIDGSASTAVGASVANQEKLHVLITGDVSFFYDSNALWNKYLGKNLRIILINNSGGGIFRIISGPSTSPQRDEFFEATHETNAEGICKSFHINYQSVNSKFGLQTVLTDFFSEALNQRPKLLEIQTPRELNAETLDAYFNYIKS
jgi:2-succinyl-5-enolpyruvyl-6-hydroxy-3-cyclohexene-1-carboxylate synthase